MSSRFRHVKYTKRIHLLLLASCSTKIASGTDRLMPRDGHWAASRSRIQPRLPSCSLIERLRLPVRSWRRTWVARSRANRSAGTRCILALSGSTATTLLDTLTQWPTTRRDTAREDQPTGCACHVGAYGLLTRQRLHAFVPLTNRGAEISLSLSFSVELLYGSSVYGIL